MKMIYDTERRTDFNIRNHFGKYNLPSFEFQFMIDNSTGYIIGFRPITKRAKLLNNKYKYADNPRRKKQEHCTIS